MKKKQPKETKKKKPAPETKQAAAAKKKKKKKAVAVRRQSAAPVKEQAAKEQAAPRKSGKNAAERERNAVFAKRMKNAGTRKAPVTLRTRGYYRFSRDYPAEVDSNGLRENAEAPSRRRRRAILWAALLAAVFMLSFVVTKTVWYLASREPVTAPHADSELAEATLTGALHFADLPLAAEEADAALQTADAEIAVLEYKTADGILHNENEALVEALHALGRKAAAYISCFKDTAGAAAYPEFAVMSYNGEEGEYWQDNAGSGWLNPFSAAAKEYILESVAAASAEGFDYILLDNVCFPSDSGATTAYFAGEADYAGTRNQLLRGFVGEAVQQAGEATTILMCRFQAFDAEAAADKAPYYGNMLGTGAGILCADARLSLQQKNLTVGEEKFVDPAAIPYAFMLAVAQMAEDNAEDASVYLCLEAGDAAEDGVRAARQTHANGFILW